MKWTREFAGRYTGTAQATLEDGDGSLSTVEVRLVLRHMPEWRGPDRWGVEVEGPEGERLCDIGDSPCRTLADAKASAAAMLSSGWKWYGAFWALR